jgi:hypothetical protein
MIQAIQRNVTWRAIPFAGLIAGTAFLIVNVILTPLIYEIDPLLILRYFGSLILGSDVLTDNSMSVVVVGVIVHYALSILFALVIALVIHRGGLWFGIIGGAILGLAIYSINLYTMTVFFEWLFAIHNTALLISHIVFGAVAGGVYEMFDHFDLPISQERVDETA